MTAKCVESIVDATPRLSARTVFTHLLRQ